MGKSSVFYQAKYEVLILSYYDFRCFDIKSALKFLHDLI